MANKRQLIWDAIRGKAYDYTSGSLRLALFMLAIPMILEMVMESLFAIVDTFWVSKISNEAVATIGITESILMIVISIAIGISIAATAMISRRVGEHRPEEARIPAANAILLGVLCAGILGVASFIYAEDILRLMGSDETLVAAGGGYTRIILGFNVILMLLFINNGIFRGAGNASIAMRTLWLANGLNIILDPILIFGWMGLPALGLEGAAIATCIGRGVGVCYQLYHLLNGSAIVKLAWADFKPRLAVFGKILKIGAGGAGQFLISTASWIFLVRIVQQFGSEATAGYTLAIRIIIFTILPSWGLSNAVATLVGQNLGAGHSDRAAQTVWTAGWYNMLFMLGVSVFFFLLSEPVVGLFTRDAAVVSIATQALKILCLGYIFFAYQMVLSQAFNGAGDTRTPTLLNFIMLWLIEVPLAYVLALKMGMGPAGVFWSITISSSLLAVVFVVLFRKGSWAKTEV